MDAARPDWSARYSWSLVGADHAAYNFDLRHPGDTGPGSHLAAPFVAAQPLLWLWPLLALAVAVALDLRWLHRARALAPDLRLRRERDGTATVQLARYAVLGMPWTPLVIARFTLLRRAALYQVGPTRPHDQDAGPPAPPPRAGPLLDEVAAVRDQLDAADSAGAWRRVRVGLSGRSPDGTTRFWLRRWWPILLWAVLLVPALVYYGIGSTPSGAGIQKALQERLPFQLLLLAPAVVGLGLLVWQLATTLRALPVALRAPAAEAATRLLLRIGTALGSAALAATTAWAWLHGAQPSSSLLSGAHILDALSELLLIAGIALLIAAFVFFPPSIELLPVVLATGSQLLIPTITVTSAFTTTTTFGALSIVLSQAAGRTEGTSQPGGEGTSDAGTRDGSPQPRHFASRDPLVADLANDLESEFPGQVIDTNVNVTRPDGTLATDIDIDTQKAAIQVKSGTGRGALSQARTTAAHTSKPVIVYGPDLGWQMVRNLTAEGFRVAQTPEQLAQIYGGLP